MIIAGAKGFAKEVLEIIYQAEPAAQLVFFDDVSADLPALLHGRYPVLRTAAEVQERLVHDRRFALGVGGPQARRLLAEKLRAWGGELTAVQSARATIGAFGNRFGAGCSIVSGVVLTSDVTLGEGVLANANCTIGHDCVLGDYCEISPGAHLSGHVVLGPNCVVGTGAVLLPGVTVGENTIIGAGSVVTKDLPANVVAVGTPAKVIKTLA